MTRRTRPLDLHGLSKNSFEGLHPLPEKPEEPLPVPTETSIREHLPISPEESEGLSLSTPSSPTTGRFSNGFFNESISSSVGTGGNTTTGRSSVYSWGNDDEFDRKASAQVHSMFNEIDSCLFENAKRSDELKEECSDWKNSFPYLRVLGNQLLPVEESGTQEISLSIDQESNEYRPSTVNNLLEEVEVEGRSENLTLSVSGHKVEAVVPPNAIHSYSRADELNSSSHSLSYLEEEVFAVDGEIEEFIAYDDNSEYRDKKQHHHRNKHRAFPPVTPHAFVHETAINECFDQVWVKIIHTLKRLLKLYIHSRARKEIERQHANFDSNMDRFLESALELAQPRDCYGRVPPLPSQLRLKTNSSIFTASTNLNGLKQLMTIRSVALQHRAPSVTNTIRDEDPSSRDHQSRSRPVSSAIGTYRQFPKATTFRAAEQQFYDRMQSAKDPKRAIRLQPLQQPPKTAGHVENLHVGEVRGTGLQTAGQQLSSQGIVSLNQQLWGARNGMLPPLERPGTADTTVSVTDNRIKSAKRQFRTSSALTNESKNSNVRELRERVIYSTLPDSRPDTNHSYRTEPVHNHRMTQQSRLRDPLHGSATKSIFHPHQTINENSPFYHFPTQSKTGSFSEEGQEVDDFILWGHGPPLISQQQRKGKTIGSSMR